VPINPIMTGPALSSPVPAERTMTHTIPATIRRPMVRAECLICRKALTDNSEKALFPSM
jgi:hypothetical protein